MEKGYWERIRELVARLRGKERAPGLEANCPRVVRFDDTGALAFVSFLGERP